MKNHCVDGSGRRKLFMVPWCSGHSDVGCEQATMQVPFVHQEEPNSLSNLGRVSALVFIYLRYCREARDPKSYIGFTGDWVKS